jgi:hypothetical protein
MTYNAAVKTLLDGPPTPDKDKPAATHSRAGHRSGQ